LKVSHRLQVQLTDPVFQFLIVYVVGWFPDHLRQFYEQEAPVLFALYGYAPMDVTVETDGEETWQVAACYQETLWHSFFREGGEPWHGRIQPFITSLISFRWREDERDGLHEGIRLAA
jgi:hypothetical protein